MRRGRRGARALRRRWGLPACSLCGFLIEWRSARRLSGQFAEAVAVEDVGDFYGLLGFVGVLHGLHEGHGDEAFFDIGTGFLVGFDAAGEVFDIVLVFAGVV